MQLAEGNGGEQTVTQATYLIGGAAEASGVTIKAIRYYEEIGLIPKVPRRNNVPHGNGHRVFSVSDVGRLKFIHHARHLNAINERIDHLRQLRNTIEDFMAGEPSSGSGACTWGTRGCMEPAGFRKTPATGPGGRIEADQFDTGNARMMAP